MDNHGGSAKGVRGLVGREQEQETTLASGEVEIGDGRGMVLAFRWECFGEVQRRVEVGRGRSRERGEEWEPPSHVFS